MGCVPETALSVIACHPILGWFLLLVLSGQLLCQVDSLRCHRGLCWGEVSSLQLLWTLQKAVQGRTPEPVLTSWLFYLKTYVRGPSGESNRLDL